MSRPSNREPRRPPIARRLRRISRAQSIFSILAILVVCALVGTAVGSPLLDALTNQNESNPIDVTDKTDDVLTQLQKAANDNPKDSAALANLGNYLANTGRIEEAIGWYEKALTLTPADTALRLDFARSLANGEKREDAEIQFMKVLAAEPNNAQGRLSLGELYARWIPPRRAQAMTEFQAVISLDRTSYLAERAKQELGSLGAATPAAATPSATAPSTPEA